MAAAAFVGALGLGALGNHQTAVAHTQVVVAAQDIQAREVLTPAMLTLASIATDSVPPGAMVRIADLSGQTALVAIPKGAPLTTNLATANPDAQQGQSAYLPIPKGFVARAIPTGEQQGVAGYIAPGDYVNVVASVNTSVFNQSPGREVTKIVFSNLHIIRVGPAQPGKAGQTEGITSSLIVVMTACDAEMMDWLIGNSRLTYVLLSYHDYASPPTAPDASCPTADPTSAVSPAEVNNKYGFTNA